MSQAELYEPVAAMVFLIKTTTTTNKQQKRRQNHLMWTFALNSNFSSVSVVQVRSSQQMGSCGGSGLSSPSGD